MTRRVRNKATVEVSVPETAATIKRSVTEAHVEKDG
jgi:hypothetical protein